MEARVLATDLGFTEGPVFLRSGGMLVTSIDRGHLYAIDEDGSVRRLVNTGGGPNGATEGRAGCIYVAQNGGRGPGHRRATVSGGIQNLHVDGRLEWVTKDLISPNDLCFGPDGFLYATDPTRSPARDDGRLWRVDVGTGDTELLTSVSWYPNGIGFAAEDDCLYVASTGNSRIVRFPLSSSGLGKPEVAIQMEHGFPDGFAFDSAGNIVIAAVSFDDRPSDIQTWSLDGNLIDVFSPGVHHYYTNLAISADRRLVITDSEGGAVLEVFDWPTSGLYLHPFRIPE